MCSLILFISGSAFSQHYSTGAIIPSKAEFDKQVARSKANRTNRLQAVSYLPGLNPNASKLDLRTLNGVTPVKNQGNCGSCWAFCAVSVIESNYKLTYGETIDASEQQALSCTNSGTCLGGWTTNVFEYLRINKYKLTDESLYPYLDSSTGTINSTQPCRTNLTGKYEIEDWGYISEDYSIKPTIAQIKDALYKYGGVGTSIISGTSIFQSYREGSEPIDDTSNKSTDHCVTIIGWDDAKQSWLIKNSWGTSWGNQGYAWVKYTSSKIGAFSNWVQVKKTPSTVPIIIHVKKTGSSSTPKIESWSKDTGIDVAIIPSVSPVATMIEGNGWFRYTAPEGKSNLGVQFYTDNNVKSNAFQYFASEQWIVLDANGITGKAYSSNPDLLSINTFELPQQDSLCFVDGQNPRCIITSSNENAIIYYTTDGSTPNPTSSTTFKYASAFDANLNKYVNGFYALTIKAVLYNQSNQPISDIITRDFCFVIPD